MPSKCFWYPIQWILKDGTSHIATANKVRHKIKVPNPDGAPIAVKKLDSSMAKEFIGVWQTPLGTNTKQLEKTTSQINSYYVFLDNGLLPRFTVWRSFWFTIWAQLKYPLPAIIQPETQGNKLMSSLYFKLLPKLGIERTLPKAHRHSSYRYGDLGLPNLFTEQAISKINMFMIHDGTDSMVDRHIKLSIEELQLELGTEVSFLSYSYQEYGPLATDCWMKHLW